LRSAPGLSQSQTLQEALEQQRAATGGSVPTGANTATALNDASVRRHPGLNTPNNPAFTKAGVPRLSRAGLLGHLGNAGVRAVGTAAGARVGAEVSGLLQGEGR